MKTTPVSLLLGVRMRRVAFGALCLLSAQPLLHAQTWTGTASQWWNDSANWKGGLPVSGQATILTFDGGAVISNNNLTNPFILHSLLFGSAAPSFQLSGAPLSFVDAGFLVQSGGNEQVVHNEVQVHSSLQVSGTGTGTIALLGGLKGDGDIVKSGSFELRLQGSGAAYTGTMQVDAGRVVVAHTSALENSTVQLNVTNGLALTTANATLGGLSGGGRFDFGATNLEVGANNQSTTYSGRIANGGASSFTKAGTGTFTLTGVSTYAGATYVQNGTLAVQGGGQIGNKAHPVSIGGNLLSPGDGALIVDGAGSRVTASLFNVEMFGSLTLRNGGAVSGPPGQNPALVMTGGTFTGYGTFDATLADGPNITATAPLTLNMQAPQWNGELHVLGTTLTIHAAGPQTLEAVAFLDSSNGLATIHAPNGFTLTPVGQLNGRGVIRGPFVDQTAGARIGLLPREFLVLTNPDFGSDQWTYFNYLPKADHVTIDGGRVDTLGEVFAFGTSITGRGAIMASVTNALVGGISNGGPSTITLTGDLALGTTAPRFGSSNRFLQTTFNLGPHRFTPVGNTLLEDSTVNFAGGTFYAPQMREDEFSTTTFAGFGMLVTGSDAANMTPVAPVATGALAAVSNLTVPANQLVQLISNAPIPIGPGQLSGGQLVSRAGFVFNGPTGLSGFGVVDGPISGSLATPLVATGPLPVYQGIIRSSTARILSTTPTLWNSAGDLGTSSFPTVPVGGATVHAPAGLILGAPGSGGPVTIHAPTVSFTSVADVRFPSLTIHGAVGFSASDIRSIPNLTVFGPATMNGATLRNVSSWSLSTPITGNGFVYGAIPPGVKFTPQGSARPGELFPDAAGDVLIVSETPYVISFQGNLDIHRFYGMIRATNGLTLEGTYYGFAGDGGLEGRIRVNSLETYPQTFVDHPLNVTLGQAGLADAVEINSFQTFYSITTFLSATPIRFGAGFLRVLSEIRAPMGIELSGSLLFEGAVGRGVKVAGPIFGAGSVTFHPANGRAVHTLDSLDVAKTFWTNTDVTFAGLPGGAPALLGRESNLVENSSWNAPQGLLLRAGSLTLTDGSSSYGKLIVDGAITGAEVDAMYLYGSLTGTGTISAGMQMRGPDALINPGAIGATGLLTMGNLSVAPDPLNVQGGVGGFVFELGSSHFDRLVVTGDLNLHGALAVSLLDGFTLGPGLSFPIIDVQGVRTGIFDRLGEGATVSNFDGWDLHVSYAGGTGNDVVLYTIPEPSAAVYLAGLGLAFLVRRRRGR